MIRDVHPGSGSRIRILIFYPSRIPNPGSRGQKGTGSGSATLFLRNIYRCCTVSLRRLRFRLSTSTLNLTTEESQKVIKVSRRNSGTVPQVPTFLSRTKICYCSSENVFNFWLQWIALILMPISLRFLRYFPSFFLVRTGEWMKDAASSQNSRDI